MLTGLALGAAGLACAVPRAQAVVGATTPFTSYEAEAGTLGGGASIVSLTAPPTTQYSSPQLEASGHAYVQLTGTGQSVTWTNNTGQNISFINVRACIPDSSGGGGITSTLDLYVNGTFRQAINVNSRQTWLYEGNNNYQGNDQNPADGDPRVFWDDFHTFITGAAVSPGSTITLKKDSANSAAFYYVDVVDLEAPPAALAQPANSLSITSYGAVANNIGSDSTTAIQNCINAAQSQGKSVWIPQGTFYLNGTNGLVANGITIQGAGMWYSAIYRNVPLPNSTPLGATFQVTSCTVKNFATDSNATSRATVDGCGGAMDTTGTNWLADSIWTQHAMSGFWASGTGGTVQNCRLTSIWADGCNINNVSLNGTVGNNLTVRNNFIRGTGDDGTAINSVNYNGTQTYTPMQNCTITNNTVIAAWGGKDVAIYGGGGHTVTNNYMSDTARYIGLGVGKFGTNGSDLTSATVTGNVIVRCGGNGFNQGQPALHIGNGGDGQGVGIVQNAVVTGNTVTNSLYDGIGFSTSSGITLKSNLVTSPGRNGIVIQPPFYPAPSGSATIQANTVTGLSAGMSPYINNSSGYTATVSGNSWQHSASPKLVPGRSVSFLSGADGDYVSADNAGANPLIANRTAAGSWETFTVVDAGNGDIALLSQANGMYVCADNQGTSPLIANRTAVGPWETFTEIDAGNGNIALLAHANSMYVCADLSLANPPLLIANRSAIGGWESYAVLVH
jgi:hypothetical protein